MKKIKLNGGYRLSVSRDKAVLSRGFPKKKDAVFSASRCDLLGRPDEKGERTLITICGAAESLILTEALIAVSREWRDPATNEIFLAADSGNAAAAEAAKGAEYVECRRDIMARGDLDAVLYKRHTDR